VRLPVLLGLWTASPLGHPPHHLHSMGVLRWWLCGSLTTTSLAVFWLRIKPISGRWETMCPVLAHVLCGDLEEGEDVNTGVQGKEGL
jgi:hypothetical protein